MSAGSNYMSMPSSGITGEYSGVTNTGGGLSAGGYMSVLGTVLQVGSQIYGASLQNTIYKANARLTEAQGQYESSVAEFNAAVSRANALAIRTVADLDIDRQKKAATRFKSGQIAGYAKAGVKLEGSPLSVMIDSAAEANLDMAITDYNAKIGILQASSREKQYNISGEIARSTAKTESSLLKAAGKYKKEQATTQGISTLLSTVSSFSR